MTLLPFDLFKPSPTKYEIRSTSPEPTSGGRMPGQFPLAETASQTAETIAGRPEKVNKAGLLVTDELEKAINRCREKVGRLSAECRRNNRRFRCVSSSLSNSELQCNVIGT